MTHEIDKYVGQRIRNLRWLKNMNQSELAEKIGVRFQQVQKYETGANRVSASRLWMIAQTLGADISSFFPDGEESTGKAPAEPFSREEALAVSRLRTMTESQRQSIFAMVQEMTKEAA